MLVEDHSHFKTSIYVSHGRCVHVPCHFIRTPKMDGIASASGEHRMINSYKWTKYFHSLFLFSHFVPFCFQEYSTIPFSLTALYTKKELCVQLIFNTKVTHFSFLFFVSYLASFQRSIRFLYFHTYYLFPHFFEWKTLTTKCVCVCVYEKEMTSLYDCILSNFYNGLVIDWKMVLK